MAPGDLLRGASPRRIGCRLSTRPAVPSARGPVSCGHGPSPPPPDPRPRRVGQRRRDGPARRRPAGARDRRAGGRPAARSGGAGDPRLRGPPGGRRGSRGATGDPPAARRRRAILRRARCEPRRGGRVRRGATAARADPPLVPAPPARPARRLGRPHRPLAAAHLPGDPALGQLGPVRHAGVAEAGPRRTHAGRRAGHLPAPRAHARAACWRTCWTGSPRSCWPQTVAAASRPGGREPAGLEPGRRETRWESGRSRRWLGRGPGGRGVAAPRRLPPTGHRSGKHGPGERRRAPRRLSGG